MNTFRILPFALLLLLLSSGHIFAAENSRDWTNFESFSEDIYRDHRLLRFKMQGQKKHYLAAFKAAFESGDSVKQVALARAKQAAFWGNDQDNDFSDFDRESFKLFRTSAWGYDLYANIYNHSGFGSFSEGLKVAKEVYADAAAKELPAAVLVTSLRNGEFELQCPRKDLAERIFYVVDQGDEEVDYFYGKSFFWELGPTDSDYKIAFKYMVDSPFFKVRAPEPNGEEYDFRSFDLLRDYCMRDDPGSARSTFKGAVFFSKDYVVVPSLDAWEKIKSEVFGLGPQ